MGPFEILITKDHPLFFIRRGDRIPDKTPFMERKELPLKNFNEEPVDGLYFKGQKELIRGRSLFQENHIMTWEADIHPEERYLMERFICGEVCIQGEPEKRDQLTRYINPGMRTGSFIPSFTTLSLDIETGTKGQLYSIGLHYKGGAKEIKKVFMGGHPTEESSPDYISYHRSEKELLLAFMDFFHSCDPDIIIGWHVIGFDLVFLQKKCRDNHISLNLGRDRSPAEIREIRGGWAAEIYGRIIIDGPPAMRGAFYNFENFKLNTVARAILGETKDIDEQGKVEEIERRYREDKNALARYNLLDCTLVTDIFEKTGLVDLTFTRARISGLSMDKIGMSVAAFDYFMLPRVHRKGYVTPNSEDVFLTGHAAGGLVFNEQPGFYDHVIVLDFKSLYPSIIRTFFIDPLSRLPSGENRVKTPVGISFSRENHVLPDYIKMLMDHREEAKKAQNPHLSQAVKILMNSFYGVMGTPKSRFYHGDLPTAVTGTGQWLLTETKAWLEEKGYTVIYGDTDSVFLCLKESEFNEFNSAGNRLVQEINDWLKEKLWKQFQTDSHLEIEYEKHFRKFFLPALRGGIGGAKKRYAGLLSSTEGEKLIFTGMEFVRSDWTALAKKFQYHLYELVFQGTNPAHWIKEFIEELKENRYDEDIVYKKRLTKPASEYTKTMPPHVKAALMLGSKGIKRRHIEYLMTKGGPVPLELNPTEIDYDHYIEKQLKPLADSVLTFLGTSFDAITNGRQLDLFS